jgi:hypothetical protein
MSDRVHSGNAEADGQDYRGWFIGHFLDLKASVRATRDVEVKWGVHLAGQEKPEWTLNAEATNLLLLISGKFRLELRGSSFLLSRQGDYVVWAPGIPHRRSAIEDSLILAVRWPSKPSDVEVVPPPKGEPPGGP